MAGGSRVALLCGLEVRKVHHHVVLAGDRMEDIILLFMPPAPFLIIKMARERAHPACVLHD